MKTRLAIVSLLVLFTSGSSAMADLSSLQDLFDSFTVAGVSSVTAATDMLADTPADGSPQDSYWHITATGNSVATYVFKYDVGGYADLGYFGVFDSSNPSNTVQLFDGSLLGPGSSVMMSIWGDGTVHINGSGIAAATFGSTTFGYYFDTRGDGASGGGFWHSDSELNSDDGADHMLAYQGTGDLVQIAPYPQAPWTANEFILAWEVGKIGDGGGSDEDYDDLVVMVESVMPVPVPGAVLLGLLGLSAAGLKLRKRS